MGWERRGNRMYFYRKERIGDRVVSRYDYGGFPADGIGAHLHVLDDEKREKKRRERLSEKQEREEFVARCQPVNDIDRRIREELAAVLTANGYHYHKGEWRKKRNEEGV